MAQVNRQRRRSRWGIKGGTEVGCLLALKKDHACWHIWLKLCPKIPADLSDVVSPPHNKHIPIHHDSLTLNKEIKVYIKDIFGYQ